jgi:hypothetical protein
MRTEIVNHRAVVAARLAADDEWSNAGEPDNGPEWEAHDVAAAREFETFRKVFETFPATAAEAAALFERLAQPLRITMSIIGAEACARPDHGRRPQSA